MLSLRIRNVMDEAMTVTARNLQNLKPFPKGQSGNPAGRPRIIGEIRDLARTHAEDAIAALAEIAADRSAPPSARVSAASELLNRGYGRPPQAVAIESSASLSSQHLAALKLLSERAKAEQAALF
jgi:hypothetical protein